MQTTRQDNDPIAASLGSHFERRAATQSALPGDVDEARAFLQSRIALFCAVGAWICAVLLAAANVAWILLGGQGVLESFSKPSNLPTLISLLAFLVIRRFCRREQELPMGRLMLLDALCVMIPAVAVAFPDAQDNAAGIAPLLAVLVTSDVLILRAVTIPSTWRRTLVIGLISTLPVQLSPFYNPGAIQEFMTHNPVPMRHVLLFLWAMIGVAGASVASQVIYGLRRSIRQARQLGQYHLVEKIGAGGMGVVYRASHALLRRPTAVKLLLPEKAGPADLARFEREVQATSQLTSPHTVPIYDFGHTPEGLFYYAMELLEGEDLERMVRRHGPLPFPRVIHVLRQVCESLAEAHDMGLVHRDVKPGNVVLGPRGGRFDVVTVLDFGLVKSIDAGPLEAGSKEGGQVAGSPHYMAPEAIQGKQVDPRADIYALGAVGYFLLAGEPVFEGETFLDVLAKHLDEAPIPPSRRAGVEIPEELEALILACLAKRPEDRPQDARTLGARLATMAAAFPWTDEDARKLWESTRDVPATATDAPGDEEKTIIVDMSRREEALPR